MTSYHPPILVSDSHNVHEEEDLPNIRNRSRVNTEVFDPVCADLRVGRTYQLRALRPRCHIIARARVVLRDVSTSGQASALYTYLTSGTPA